MSNGGELMVAQAAREQRRVMVVGDGQHGRSILAALLGMGLATGAGASMIADYLPKMRAGNKYEPHQGKKERERNLRRLQRQPQGGK